MRRAHGAGTLATLSIGLTSGLAVGEAPGAPMCPEYEPPFAYAGEVYSVTIDVSGDLIDDHEATLRRLMARQGAAKASSQSRRDP